jgi:ECF transporter S component (folate family)
MSRKSRKFHTKTYVCIAALSAIGVILGKLLAINVTDFLRFSLENLTIILTGIIFGPVAGGIIGALQDIVGCLVVGYAINPIITLGSSAIGIIAGVFWRVMKHLPLLARLGATVSLSHLTGSVMIKSLGLAVFYAMPYLPTALWRVLNYLLVGSIEVVVLYFLLKSKHLLSQINKIHPFSLGYKTSNSKESDEDI